MTAKKEKAKTPETESRADNVRKMRAAMKPWLAATEKVNPDPLGFDSAPPWVERAFLEVIKVLLPSNKLPPPEEWDLETLGEFFGTVQMLGKMLTGQIPIGPEMQAGFDSLKNSRTSSRNQKRKPRWKRNWG